MRRRRNDRDGTLGTPPVALPRVPAVRDLVLSMLWEYASADAEGRSSDLCAIHDEHRPVDLEDWMAAEAWLTEKGLVDLDRRTDKETRGTPTDAGWSLLRWWGWDDVEPPANPDDIGPGDFLVIREPATRRYYIVACEERGCLRLVGPRHGASSPSSAAMHARRIGGPEARVFLQEEATRQFPISREANILVVKERLTAV